MKEAQFKDISVPPIQTEPFSSRHNHLMIAFHYGLALLYSLGGIVVLEGISQLFPGDEPPIILLALCVTATAWQGGFGPGFVATLLVALGSWGLLIPPEGFAAPHPTQVMRLILIVASGTAVSYLAGRLHRTMELLQQSEMRVRSVLDTAALGIMECDGAGTIILANRQLLKMLSYPLSELLGKSIRDLTPPEDRPVSDALYKSLHEGSKPIGDYVTRYLRFDGSSLSVHVTVAPVRDVEGRFLGSIGTIEDITARKRYEEDLARSNRDLEQFASVVSHDLQEPLRMVEAFGGLLKDRHAEKLDGEAREYLNFITSGTNRMSTLIRGLLDYSRVDRGAFAPSDTDMNALVTEVLSNLRVAVESAQATVKTDSLPVIHGNQTQLMQLFQNLIENAMKYRKPAVLPVIAISAKRQADFWRFSVKDNGLGIDPRHHDRIFELFQRLHTAEEYAGIGMGLAVCKKIVERHGGRIWVDSTPGNGATFMFTLPGSPERNDTHPG
jgi:PAS domain S-box-containing protein